MVSAGAAALAASPDRTADDLFDEALAVVGGERWAFDHARIQLAFGEHLRRCRETGPARRHLGAALATFQRLSAEPWTVRARDELRATGLRSDAARAVPGPRPAPLTPEEHAVTALAASGLTNKQIADRLHLSDRTVAARLHQVFLKLSVTSRAGLRDALVELSGHHGRVAP
jgi:DNA-binding CsgD family transcriptional regulator